MLIAAKFSLITNLESEISSAVTEAEAKDFLKIIAERPRAITKKVVEEDLDLIE
jgi:hypothetical protein